MNAQEAMAEPVRHSRAAMWRRQHAWCLRDSLRQLARRPFGTALTIVVMGLALALPLAFYLLVVNVQHLTTALGDSQSVNVFLKTDVAADGAGIADAGGYHRALVGVADIGFGRGNEARAEIGRARAKRQRRRQAGAVGEAAGSDHRHLAAGAHDGAHQHLR